jgi:site-specific DNA-methyltransferase (adenine-specific)
MTLGFQIELGDAIEYTNRLADGSVDLVVTDPAYESLEKHRATGTTTRLKRRWFPVVKNAIYPELFAELYRVLAKNAHCYVFTDMETMPHMVQAAEKAGFRFWKPLVWDKVSIGMGYHYRAQYEFILFFEKGKRRLADLGVSDVMRVRRVRTDFPTEKPRELITTLVKQSSAIGETVFDPFAGSASAGAAAFFTQRSFLGCDIDLFTVNEAKARLAALGWSETKVANYRVEVVSK